MDIRPIDANELKKQLGEFNTYDSVLHARAKLEGAPTLSLNTLRDAIYQDALKHGLWNDKHTEWPSECARMIENEVDELWCAGEEWEDDGVDLEEPDANYVEELADVIIMSMSVAGRLGIDIDAAIRRKMEINKQRPWKHGKND